METSCLPNIGGITNEHETPRQWVKEENDNLEASEEHRPTSTTTNSESCDKANHVENIVIVPELNVGLQSQRDDEEMDSHQSVQKCFEDCKYATETLNNCKAEEARNTLHNWSQPIGHIDPDDNSGMHCPNCNFSSSDLKELKQHINSHPIEKTYNCKVCSYTCPGPWKLKKHMQIHSDDKLHCCELCDYCCSEAWRLKRHVKVHTGDKTHCCPVCGYTGPDSWKLKRHMRIHTGEKPYSCTYCEYCSSDSWKVKRHMRVHSKKSC